MNRHWRNLIFLSMILLLCELSSTVVQSQTCAPLSEWPLVEGNWTKCEVLSNGTSTVNNIYAECMYLNVPISWNKANLTNCTTTIEIFVKRYVLLGHENRSHHLWRIPGGGGIPVSTLENEALSVISALGGSISIYVTDKRGVGFSSPLECPTSIIQNFSACASYIKDHDYRLKQNTFTNTAYDFEYVLNIIYGYNREHLNKTQRVVVMGSSQGTYLLQRYLHVSQDHEQVDAVIFDSILPSDITQITFGDKYLNYIYLDLFMRCSQDQQGCAKYFPDENPMRALYSYKMNEDFPETSSCLYLLNITTVDIAKKMSYIFYPNMMQMFPSLIYRINRCTLEDQRVLETFLNASQAPPQDNEPGYSILVELNNNLAELWAPISEHGQDLSCEYIKGVSMNTFVSTHVMPDIYCPIQQASLLGYPTDEFYRKYPTKKSKIPILLLHGDMDSSLPVAIARHFVKQYSSINSNLTYVELPRTGHTPLSASPMVNEPGTCGWNLAITFLLSDNFQPDRSCLKNINQIDFAGQTEQSKQIATLYFGTDHFWDTNVSNHSGTNSASSIDCLHLFTLFRLLLCSFFLSIYVR